MSRKLLPLFIFPLLSACGGGDEPEKNEWADHTYTLTIGERSWTEPRGVITDISAYVPQFLFTVEGSSPSSFSVTTAPALAGVQDLCSKTSSLPGSGNAIGPADFPLRIKHLREDIVVQATLRDFTLTDALPTKGVASTTGSFAATLDARDVAPLFTQIDADPTPDELCDALSQLSPPVPCDACPHDGAAYCLTLKAEKVGVVAADDIEIAPVETPDTSCN